MRKVSRFAILAGVALSLGTAMGEPVKSGAGMDGIERSGVKPYKHRVEYLEVTGTQWIGLPYREYSPTVEIDMDVMVPSRGTWRGLWGTRQHRQFRIYSAWASTNTFCWCCGSDGQQVVGFPYGIRCQITIPSMSNQLSVYTNGTIVAIKTGYSRPDIPASTLMPLLATSQETNNRIEGYAQIGTRIYGYREIEQGVRIKLIPVIDKEGNVCMYDEVSGEFFYNKGAGHFIAGPIVE